ncbi:MAG: asparagine synthase (glutamine-hydrolyzing) [Nanoarchaeota archaeon]|nr:asparagine synthase (glutamine-hydrolyzing) [Nanoarchaeota archaeon]
MCGIAGFSWNDKALLKRMCDAIVHRGPDQFGYYEDKGISLGHRRLSIIDLSDKAKQPMFNEDCSIALVYNGEIYNFKTLRDSLEKKGHRFKSETDSEVIIHAYEEFGEDCVQMFNGMFAFALWDNNKKKLFMARDRAGIKPLYYWFDGTRLMFASEIKAIIKNEEVIKAIDKSSLYHFLGRKVVFGNKTFFEGINKLLPGHTLMFHKGAIEIKPYYSFEFKQSSDKYDFEETFGNVIKDMLVADVPIGVFLSGGLDSSLVTAFMAKHQAKVSTFTVGFGLETDEFSYAKQVAEKFSTDHHELNISFSDMTKVLDKVIWHMDEPIADPAILPTYIMSSFARKKATVCLIGEGADELFAGYSKYRLTKYLPKHLYFSVADVVFSNSKKKRLLNKACFEKAPESYLKPYFKIKNSLCSAMAFDFREIMPNFQLMKVDKMTMANSLEARVPFLDNRIIRLGEEIKNKYKLHGKMGKWLLRETAKKALPPAFSTDKKRSFYTPLRDWFNSELIDTAYSELICSELFNQDFVDKIFKQQKESIRRYKYSTQLWMLYVIEKWHKRFIS